MASAIASDTHQEAPLFLDERGCGNPTSVTVVIPAYNERGTISRVVEGTCRFANRVIVVDDGSDDGTGELALSAGASVIRIPKNTGKGNALAIGLNTAALSGCDVVVCLDADGQHDPSDIPRIVKPIRECRADMVIGSRFLSKESKSLIPAYRKVGQGILTLATNLGNSVKVTDSQSGYRAFTCDAIKGFPFSEAGMGIESEMVRNAVKSRMRIQEVPITVRYDGAKTSTYKPSNHGIAVLGSIIKSVRSDHPLLYFGLSGLAMTIVGVSFGLFSMQQYFAVNAFPFGPSVIAVTMATLGVLFMSVGLILSAIGEMAKGRDNDR